MTSHRTSTALWVGLALVCLPSRSADAQCSPVQPAFTGVNQHSIVNLVYSGQNAKLSQGAAMWNYSCGPGVPIFSISSQSNPGGINITVLISTGPVVSGCAQTNDCGCALSQLQNGELIGGIVRFTTHESCGDAAKTVAHELGHILGLTHTSDPACTNRIMYQFTGGSATVQASDCGAVDGLWSTAAENDPGEPVPPEEYDVGTPILLDLDRNLFHLTGLSDPVAFDIDADGEIELLSWTSGGTLDAFLYFDRNGNNLIDSGAELFGNRTPLVDGSFAQNGYIPLAEFDLSALGGNSNGVIDAGDLMYQDLGVWIDWNHDGISETSELASLPGAGITRIGLQYLTTRIRDQHGNYFRYIGRAWILINGHERTIPTTDVFFLVADP